VDVAALSHQGNVRLNNEDVYFVARADRTLTTLMTNLPEGFLPPRFEESGYGMLVADGIGGMAGGEVASRLAVRTLVDLVVNSPDWIMHIDEQESERLMERIARRYREVDAAIKLEARSDPQLWGMGTTLTLAYSLGSDLFLGHVGDSRVYFAHRDEFYQLTRDHTCAQAFADLGLIQPEEVLTHRFRHVLTRAMGAGDTPVEADLHRVRLSDGDQVLLCSDGLSEMVDDAAIAGVLRSAATAAKACQALVELALQNGGKDNVTVILARYRFVPAS
jgi:protein phosphatase